MQWRQQARQQAQVQGIDPVEVDRLLAWAGWERLHQLQGIPPVSLQTEVYKLCSELWQARLDQRIPLHYLMGEVMWRDLTLRVDPGVLIPRPETELLVDVALDWLTQHPPTDPWLDLGTGSGAIAIALARAWPELRILAVDLSPEALQVAAQNIDRYQVGSQIELIQGCWFEPLGSRAGGLGGLVSNPPYIPTAEIDRLQPEVRLHEPHLALDGGPQGTEVLQHLITTAPHYLKPGSLWACELMIGQADWVCAQLEKTQVYDQIQQHPDLAGIPRVVSARRL